MLLSGQDSEADLVVLTRVLKAQELNRDLEVATRELQNYVHFCLPLEHLTQLLTFSPNALNPAGK